mmetsp:Transcript_31319/g.36012  ORF Transcript_31319/g.36012 Transcript_31319/m.36012 type:complete len:694 (+) Transcript_31319:74-2155(+)
MSTTNHPPCRILCRSKNAVEIYTVHESPSTNENATNSNVTVAKGLASMHCFSDDGTKLLLLMPSSGVKVVDLTKTSNNEEVTKSTILLENTKGVQMMNFSPLGTYILTWERLVKGAATVATKDDDATSAFYNLKLWSSVSGRLLHGFQMRNCKRDQWPPVRWSHDEKYAFHQVTNELHVYKGHAFSDDDHEKKYIDKVRCSGMTSFSIPSNSNQNAPDKYLISTFVGETKGKPARVSLLRYPDRCGTSENSKSGHAIVSKSFYQAEECSVSWSPQGDAALILTTTTVDSSGESYYGSTNLYLLLGSPKTAGGDGEALLVPLPKSNSASNGGPVLDASWMPNANKPSAFAVISGKMPALTSLHHGTTAEPTHTLGNAHRNTIVWSDHGRFLTVGGFGNLAGGMDFYDRNKMKTIPQFDPNTGVDLGTRGNNASCAVGFGWSPSSRYFMVSTTSPRMNVDNGVALYKYNGTEIKDESIISWDNSKFLPNLLLAAEFIPAKRDVYPDRPQTPPPRRAGNVENEKSAVGKGEAGTVAPAGAYVPPSGRYVPPGARKTGTGMSLADRMRKERQGSSVGVTKVAPKGSVVGATAVKLPVGMTPVDGGKSKNALRKEKQRLAKKKAEEEEKAEAERKAVEEKEKLAAAADDPVKRSKKLRKILKQIADLKGKDLSTLNDDQRKKLSTEAKITQELESLNV